MASVIDPATIAAYRATEYQVGDPPAFGIRIGVHSVELADLHRTHRVAASAFVTACNPFGQSLPDDQNAQHHRALCADVERRGLNAIEGVGEDPAGQWQGERSVLILGATRELTIELGHLYEQNAVVWSGADALPELILLR